MINLNIEILKSKKTDEFCAKFTILYVSTEQKRTRITQNFKTKELLLQFLEQSLQVCYIDFHYLESIPEIEIDYLKLIVIYLQSRKYNR